MVLCEGHRNDCCYEFHLWKSFLYEMAIWRGPSRYQRQQTPGHCIRGPGIAWLRFGNRDHLPQVQVDTKTAASQKKAQEIDISWAAGKVFLSTFY